MPSEHFHSEKPPTSPTEAAADDRFNSGEQITDQSDATGSFIHDGGIQLAENLSKIAEHGPEGIQAYLTDILANTDGKAPTAERAAVFALLAEKQKQRSREQVITAGAKMSHNVVASAKEAQVGTRQFANQLSLPVESFATQPSRSSAQRTQSLLEGLNKHRLDWVKNQQDLGRHFATKLKETTTADAALREGGESLTQDYEGPAIDLTALIDPAITEGIALQFHQEAADGESLKATIDALLTPQEDEITLEKIYLYSEFSKKHANLLNRIEKDKDLGADQQRDDLNRFQRQGVLPRQMQSFIAQVKENPHKLNGAFGSVEGISKRLARDLSKLDQPITTATETIHEAVEETVPSPTQPLEARPIEPEEAPMTPVVEEIATEPIVTNQETEATAEPEASATEQPPAPLQEAPSDRPDYASAAGEQTIIDPTVAAASEMKTPQEKPSLYRLKNLGKESLGANAAEAPQEKTWPKPENRANQPEPAPSPYQEGYVRSSTTHAPKENLTPTAEPGFVVNRAKLRGTYEAASNRYMKQQVGDKPAPKIARGNETPQPRRADPNAFYAPRKEDIVAAQRIIDSQRRAEAARFNQTPKWIQDINNPVGNRKSRAERYYESRTGRLAIKIGSHAVRAGRFLRRKLR